MQPFYESLPSGLRAQLFRGFNFPEHLHAQVEMICVLSGRAIVLVDGAEYALEPGDVCLCFPNTVHGYRKGSGAGAEGVMLIFSPEISPDFGKALLAKKPESPIVRAGQLAPDVRAAVLVIASEIAGQPNEPALKAYVQVILARVMPLLPLADADAFESRDLFHRAMLYISAHFDEPLTLDALSAELNASAFHLSHVFARRLGMNFRAYINLLRVSRAQVLLRDSSEPITRICFDCGFENQRTFNRAFQAVAGTTPSEYRRATAPT